MLHTHTFIYTYIQIKKKSHMGLFISAHRPLEYVWVCVVGVIATM